MVGLVIQYYNYTNVDKINKYVFVIKNNPRLRIYSLTPQLFFTSMKDTFPSS